MLSKNNRLIMLFCAVVTLFTQFYSVSSVAMPSMDSDSVMSDMLMTCSADEHSACCDSEAGSMPANCCECDMSCASSHCASSASMIQADATDISKLNSAYLHYSQFLTSTLR